MIANPSYKSTGCGCGGGSALPTAPCSCGGSECAACQGQGIVRPRFFAGQLLTEDDLQLLTDYVGYKDRLHNRHLFGAGVVCGLEVSCHPCGDGRVIVHPGYALDCCGNDLTLACAQILDINSMIRDLRRDQLGGFDCGDPCLDPEALVAAQPPAKNAQGNVAVEVEPPKPERRYCLYIRYCEQASDPVMPYSTGDDCGQVSCQPTRTREGVKFELRCPPLSDAANPLIQRLCACIGDINQVERIFKAFNRIQKTSRVAGATLVQMGQPTRTPTGTPIPPGPTDPKPPSEAVVAVTIEQINASLESFRELRDWLSVRFNNSPFLTDCTLRDKVHLIVVPEVKRIGPTEIRTYLAATEPLMELFINFLRDCVCRAFNPACVPCDDSAVLLACLTVDECNVIKICNLERTFVLSPAAVRYWLAPLQLAGNVIERLCCDPLEKLLTNGTEQSFRYDLDNFDIGLLLKEEGIRILADSLCLVNKEVLGTNVDKVMPRRLKKATRKTSVEETTSMEMKPQTARAEARTASAGKAAAAPSKAKVPSAARKTSAKSRKSAAVKSDKNSTPEPAPVANGNGAKTNGPKGGQP